MSNIKAVPAPGSIQSDSPERRTSPRFANCTGCSMSSDDNTNNNNNDSNNEKSNLKNNSNKSNNNKNNLMFVI